MESKNYFILHKFIPCLLITIFAFMCLYGSFVYASDDTSISITINDVIYNIPFPSNIQPSYLIGDVLFDNRDTPTVPTQVTFYSFSDDDIEKVKFTKNSDGGFYFDFLERVMLHRATYLFSKSNWLSVDDYETSFSAMISARSSDYIFTTFDMYNREGELLLEKNISSGSDLKAPIILNSVSDLETLNFDYLNVNTQDYNDNDVYLLVYDYNIDDPSDITDYLITSNEILLNHQSKYNKGDKDFNYSTYFVPVSDLHLDFKIGGKYGFRFALREHNDTTSSSYYKFIGEPFTFSVSSDINKDRLDELNKYYEEFKRQQEREEELQVQKDTTNAVKEQTEVLKEQNETNKNIFERLGDLLSFINPFSDNFFGKKLVELILDGLKSLFVPDEGFFDNYFTDLKNWFSDRFGLLFYPFELLLDVLNKLLNMNLSEPSFNIPEIKEPVTGGTLIQEQHFNFNSLLEYGAFKTMHDIYFIIVDAIIIFALVNLIKHKLEEVETK